MLAERSVPFPFAPEIKRFTMVNRMQFYIDGAWVDPVIKKSTPVVNPATEEAMYEVALGSSARSRPFPRPAARSASRCCRRLSKSTRPA